jgi:hypothetical protein
MPSRNVVFPSGLAQWADVGTPQVVNLVGPSYQSGMLSDKVRSGRAKSAFNSEQVPGTREGSEAPQERWSRGCRRAHVSFWFWLQLQLWPLVPKKKSRCPSRLPRKSWTPASTSNDPERACRRTPGGPAPSLGLLHVAAVCRPEFLVIITVSCRALWAVTQLWPIRSLDCKDRGQTRC